MVCGFGENISYEKLVASICDEKLDKTMQYTNWAQRPLSDRQIEYAAADVLHLKKIQEKLTEMAGPKVDWLKEEQENLESPSTYEVALENAWARLKVRYSMSPLSWGVLRAVASWREGLARARDVPRSHVLKDDIVVALALKMPKTENDLQRIKEMPPLKSDMLESLFEAIKGATPFDNPLPKKPAESLAATLDLLKILLKIKSEENKIVSRMIASTSDLEALLLGGTSLPLLQGWRRELFGEDAEKLLQGKLTICLDADLKPITQHI
jgi:ribonuclease D